VHGDEGHRGKGGHEGRRRGRARACWVRGDERRRARRPRAPCRRVPEQPRAHAAVLRRPVQHRPEREGASDSFASLPSLLSCASSLTRSPYRPQDILTRTLSENGVPSPSHLSAHVTEDVDRYGQRLTDLLAKLERTRQDQLDSFFTPSAAVADELERAEQVFDADEAFADGAWATRIGEDYFGVADQGLDTELAVQNLVLPKWLLRGEPRPLDNESTRCVRLSPLPLLAPQRALLTATCLWWPHSSTLAYSPPPSFVPLTPSSISAQIGLLQPFYHLRASHASLGLTEDPSLSPQALALAHGGVARAKAGGTRHKVPPSGRIPFKGKKRPDDPTLPGAIAALLQGANEPVKKKKRSKALAVVEEVPVESGAE